MKKLYKALPNNTTFIKWYLGIAFCILLIVNGIALVAFVKNQPTDTQQAANRILDICKQDKGSERCYAREFNKLTKQKDLKYSTSVLFALQKLDYKARGCHFIAHNISYAETLKNVNRWKELLKDINSTICSGGFLHGIIEIYMQTHPEVKIDRQLFTDVCSTMKGGGEWNCSHIMGHLILVEKENNIDESAKLCDQMPEKYSPFECYSGIFMEYMTRENLSIHEIAPRREWNEAFMKEVETLCNNSKGTAADGCWREIAHMYDHIYHSDPQKVFSACNRASTKESVDYCYRHAIGILSSYELKDKTFDMLCEAYENDTDKSSCIEQLAGSMLYSSSLNVDKLIPYCNRLPDKYKATCYASIITYLPSTEQGKICSKFPKSYQNVCSR